MPLGAEPEDAVEPEDKVDRIDVGKGDDEPGAVLAVAAGIGVVVDVPDAKVGDCPIGRP